METITLKIDRWPNERLKDIKKEEYEKCGLDVIYELTDLMVDCYDDKLSRDDYRWLLLQNLSDKKLLNTIHMIMSFNNIYYDDFFEYTEEQLKKAYEELKEELEASTNE